MRAFFSIGAPAAALLCALHGAAPSAHAQAPADPQTQLSEQVDLARLVDLCAQRLRLNLQYDPAVLKGTVTLRLGAGVSDGELWTLTNRLLASAGFTTVQLPGEQTLSVVRLADAPTLARLEDPLSAAKAGFVKVIRPLTYRGAKEVIDSVAALLSKPAGSATALDGGRRLLLSDLRPQVEQALTICDLLDVDAAPPAAEEIVVRHARATEIVALVERIAASQSAAGGTARLGKVLATEDNRRVLLIAPATERTAWRSLLAQLDQPQALQTVTYAPRAFSVREVARLLEEAIHGGGAPGDGWRVVVDSLTSSLIVTATASQHREIEALVARLEASTPATRRPLRSFPILNRSVGEVVEVLNRLIDGGALEAGRIEGAATNAAATNTAPSAPPAAASQNPAALAPGAPSFASPPPLTLTADLGTNTLVAVGEGRLLDQLGELLQQIDVRQPQVLLEARVVALNDSDILTLGVELSRLQRLGDATATLASLFGLGTPAIAGPLPAASGTGFSGVVLNPADFSALVRALETTSVGRTATSPRVLVANHQQARLDSTLQQPYLSTNASNTVATTSFGGSLDAGTVLSVKPQITEADHLLLEYTVTISSFVGASPSPQLPPPRQQNSLQSQVTIPDGYTVVVGGLDVDSESEATSQVPLLGDIPWLGAAFRSRTTTKTRSRLFVFLRASVMRDRSFEDLQHVSAQAARGASLEGELSVEPAVMR